MFFVCAGIFKSKKPGPSFMGRPGVLAIMALVLHKHGDRASPFGSANSILPRFRDKEKPRDSSFTLLPFKLGFECSFAAFTKEHPCGRFASPQAFLSRELISYSVSIPKRVLRPGFEPRSLGNSGHGFVLLSGFCQRPEKL
jgi:hypothetical protein